MAALNAALEGVEHSMFVTSFGKKEFLSLSMMDATDSDIDKDCTVHNHPILILPRVSAPASQTNVNSYDFAFSIRSSCIHTASVNMKTFCTRAWPMSQQLSQINLNLSAKDTVVSELYSSTVFPLFGEFSNVLGEEGARQFMEVISDNMHRHSRTADKLSKLVLAGGVEFCRHTKHRYELGGRMFVSKIKVGW